MSGVVLRPRDGFFFKDGRGWTTSSVGRASGLAWPFPSSVIGAIRTAWGLKHLESSTGASGAPNTPWEVTRQIRMRTMLPVRRERSATAWTSRERLWPVPADALYLDGDPYVYRLNPIPTEPGVGTLGLDDDASREALWYPRPPSAAKPILRPAWWTDAQMTAWTRGEAVSSAHDATLTLSVRTTVQSAIGATTGTASSGRLFATELTETQTGSHEWAIGVLLDGLDRARALPELVMLGGDRRLAYLEPVSDTVFDWHDERWPSDGSTGLRLILATAMQSASGWCLPDFAAADGPPPDFRGTLPGVDGELALRAAIVPRPWHVSGWDMELRAPKPTRRLIPAGAAFFLVKASGETFSRDEARRLWLSQLGEGCDEGFGSLMPAVWNPSR